MIRRSPRLPLFPYTTLFRSMEGIFYPNSALHDKAVIVRDQRIAAANCTLPLSEGPGSARLGTRHRAAIGITERTDAISRSEEHTSELQSLTNLVCRLLLEKK